MKIIVHLSAKTGDAKPSLSAFLPTKTTPKQYISVSKSILLLSKGDKKFNLLFKKMIYDKT